MSLRWKAGFLLVGAMLFGAAPVMAAPDVVGSWKVSFFAEPNHSGGSTHCMTFKKTGGILGEPNSGTWQAVTSPGWKGEWIQEGDYVRWYGIQASGISSHAHSGLLVSSTIMTGEFDTFTSAAKTSNSGTWSATKVNQCTSSSSANAATGSDVTR
jgi:hypothetical protein